MIEQPQLDGKIKELLDTIYAKRIEKLSNLTLNRLLGKNPYLYCAIGVNDPGVFVEQVLIAFVSSSDETIFGNEFFEPLALWAAQSSTQHGDTARSVNVGAGAGQDIAIETATAYLAISVKSGKNIFNAQSNKGQRAEFESLRARLKKLNKQFRAIVGYGYGRGSQRKATSAEKVAGQVFWTLLTGEEDFYLRMARAIKRVAGKHGKRYKNLFEQKRNELLRQFVLNFVDAKGNVLWEDIVAYNSSREKPQRLQ